MKLFLSAVLIAVMLLAAVPVSSLEPPASGSPAAEAGSPFADISQSYAAAEIASLYRRGIVDGVSPGRFAPERPVTRAEFVKMLDAALSLQPVESGIPAFTDVPSSAWHYGWIQAALLLGIADGTGPSVFQPNQPVTRQEAAVLLVRALKQPAASGDGTSAAFADAAGIAAWARPSVGAAYRLGLMQGDAAGFRPLDPVTRQETAAVLSRALILPAWSEQFGSKPRSYIQIGWQYGQSNEEFKRSVSVSTVNTISPRWFFLDKNGSFTDEGDASLAQWAHDGGRRVWAMAGNRFDRQTTHDSLSDPDRSAKLVKQLAGYVHTYGLDGINLDFENVAAEDRDAFTGFVASLAAALHQAGAMLSVNVPPDLGNDWSDPYDYAALGRAADYIVLMGYDEHWEGGPLPGSVSSLPWFIRGMDRLTAAVPAAKTIAGLPFYTRDWYRSGGGEASDELTLAGQNERIRTIGAVPVWDPAVGQYTADYNSRGIPHRLWVEDSRSFTLKLRAAAEAGCAGFAYWYIGGETPDLWKTVLNVARYGAGPLSLSTGP